VEERRAARIGTVSGLALLAGGTAVAAAAGGARSVFATVLLVLLTAGMGHALLDEIRRQARRRSAGGWATHDTLNTVLLASWAGAALIGTVLAVAPPTVRAAGLTLTLGYAASCAYFVRERRRAITTLDGQRRVGQHGPVSFDLVVVAIDPGVGDEAVRAMVERCRNGPHPDGDLDDRVVAFYQSLRAHYPDHPPYPDDSPWNSMPLDVGIDHVSMSISFGRGAPVLGVVDDLARQYGLTIYDPQGDAILRPADVRTRTDPAFDELLEALRAPDAGP
jgi:hypothetical protein